MKSKLIVALLSSIFFLLMVSVPSYTDLPERSIIINNVPELLEIQDFKFKIDSYDDEIRYEIKVKNNTDQSVEAYMVTFAVFDYFNERCTGTNGISHTKIKPKSTKTATWKDSDYSAWQGLTGFAFISDIRLGDDTVIKANTEEIAQKISEILGNPVHSEDLNQE